MTVDSYLKFDNDTTTYGLVNCKIVTKREDNGFHPTTEPKVDYIELTVVCQNSVNKLYDWFVTNNLQSGFISFALNDVYGNDILKRQITFSGAQCFNVVDNYNKNDYTQRQLTLQITMSQIEIDNNVFLK